MELIDDDWEDLEEQLDDLACRSLVQLEIADLGPEGDLEDCDFDDDGDVTV